MGRIRVIRAVGSRIQALNDFMERSDVKYIDLKTGRTQDAAGQWHDVWVLVCELGDNEKIEGV